MNLQEIKIRLIQQTAIQKIDLVVTKVGAIVNQRIYKGRYLLKSHYAKGKITIFDENNKKDEVIDLNKKTETVNLSTKQKDKKTSKKELKDDTTLQDMPDASV